MGFHGLPISVQQIFEAWDALSRSSLWGLGSPGFAGLSFRAGGAAFLELVLAG